MKDIKRLGCILIAVITSMMATSCLMDEIIGQAPIESVESELIAFGAALSRNDQDDLTTKSSAESYGNRIGNRILSTADSSMTLPMGIYVQNGIHSAGESYGPATKGSVVSSKEGISDFAVWANYKKSDTETMSYFSNVNYAKADDGIFYPVNATDEYYWPGAGTLNFYALANAPESGFTANIESDVLKSFSYTVPTDPTEQGDILLASASAAGNSNASVPLTFDHIMSAVNIKVGAIVVGEIRSITLKNVYNKGTYHVEQGVWVVDKSSVADFTVKMEGDKFVSTGSQAEGTPINTSDATFMFIPQNPGDNAEVVIEFFESGSGHWYSDDPSKNPVKPSLRASIAGDNWDKRKTTNYMLSIDESYTLSIEPVGKKLDAHYVIGFANVTVQGIDNWEIKATTSDGSSVTIQPESEVNPLAKQGFWTDKVVDANGNITNESARGASTWKGSGPVTNERFYIFIEENINDKDREISLILRGTGSSSASTTKVLLQKYPNWTSAGFGWEVVDDAERGKYGFKWTRKVAIVYPYWRLAKSNAVNQSQDYIDQYNADENGFASVGTYSKTEKLFGFIPTTSYRSYIWLDYTVLNSVTDANSSTDGYANTHALYKRSGTTASSQFETILLNTYKTESGKEHENLFRIANESDVAEGAPAEQGKDNDLSAALEYIQKKNKYYLQINNINSGESDGSGKLYVPYFFESDLKWYLPAYSQFDYFIPDPNINGDDKSLYWSSTAPAEEENRDYAYIGNGSLQDRDLEYRVIAVRKDENDYGATTATVDNTSLAGGDNGSTNNWL